ncbi:hypothetical protein COW94_02180 [Candidatus Peregrinibacteria bacterium CG22_combo_CG10-13_8_21_14_all_44_10]|nr:MAG: hypothetical protein AUK45_00215 [Candidatus Peregrinibacteria bacterium CG2_30_44_17]PIP66358.1 MAG: hypothetical protein COW94_02180 [Candidatus Peregrinibacteria bacterium CG22_combo_CG10-13_8_21_14_all_44_10]PIS04134.1 MAG: hypothetical protein COT83_02175 [Candidatus Peregrinibacteria bacterium CG10_big_fil_rev_8_21_14_0_10_44_7]PIX79212.1 MAG: hypothetical protein COZ35_03840 [Candidatus Peregrinibacteria bacterium CG_4_10_14_3_um_filter_44_21]PJB89526.1 MAG: hypothetical protein 
MDIFCNINDDDELSFESVLEPSEDLFVATLKEFRKTISLLNEKASGVATYIFQKMEGDHWVLQEDIHDDDEFDCAIFRVIEGNVYALSMDVMKFFKKALKKF